MAWSDAARAAAARTRRQATPVSSGISGLKQKTRQFLMGTRYKTGPLPEFARQKLATKLKAQRVAAARVKSLKSQMSTGPKPRVRLTATFSVRK